MSTHTVDEYAISSKYYDMFMAGRSNGNRVPSVEFFAAVADGVETVLDLGAGTGRVTIAAARRGARVWAAEPSPSMRTILRERLAQEPDSGHRVTVTAHAVPDFELARTFDAVLMSGVLQHVSAEQRPRLLRQVAAHLGPSGWFATDMVGGTPPDDDVTVRIGDTVVEGYRYVCDLHVHKLDTDVASMTFAYQKLQGSECVESEVTQRVRHFVKHDDFLAELAAAQLRPVTVAELPARIASVIPDDAMVVAHM